MNYYNIDHNLMAGGRRILPDGPLPTTARVKDFPTVKMELRFNGSGSNQQFIAPFLEDGDVNVFEAAPRSRAYTWNGRMPTQNSVVLDDISLTSPIDVEIKQEFCDDSVVSTGKKAGTHRNAWGSLSYADLITKAIESSPSQRLTLAQIYAWMVDNVPFFSDKGDTNSSAGWKVCCIY